MILFSCSSVQRTILTSDTHVVVRFYTNFKRRMTSNQKDSEKRQESYPSLDSKFPKRRMT